MSDNPLAQYFRAPAIYITLPTGGRFYPPGAINIPEETGELPVYPMSAMDEITYKTPDALFNGSAVADVIKSCVPAIQDPWSIPVPDLATVLAGIRIASFGHNMDVDTVCPHCGHEEKYDFDLRNLLDGAKIPDYDKPFVMGDLQFYFQPILYKDVNANNKLQFEEQQLTRLLKIPDTDLTEEEKVKALSDTFKKVAEYTMQTLTKNIKTVVLPDATVSDQAQIREYLQNCEGDVFKAIKAEVIKFKAVEALKPLTIKCNNEKCSEEFDYPVTLDMSSFFDKG